MSSLFPRTNHFCPLVFSLWTITSIDVRVLLSSLRWLSLPLFLQIVAVLFTLLWFAGLKDDKFNIWVLGCAKSTAGAMFTVYFIMETEEGHREAAERELSLFAILCEKSLFFPVSVHTHTHTITRTKCPVIKAVSIHYVVKGPEMIDAHMNWSSIEGHTSKL